MFLDSYRDNKQPRMEDLLTGSVPIFLVCTNQVKDEQYLDDDTEIEFPA